MYILQFIFEYERMRTCFRTMNCNWEEAFFLVRLLPNDKQFIFNT